MLSPEVVVFAASVTGSLARAIIPYLRKLKEAEEAGTTAPEFQKKYIFTAILAVVVSAITGVLLYPSIAATIPQGALSGIFVYGFIAGWGALSIFNEIMATGTSLVSKPTPP